MFTEGVELLAAGRPDAALHEFEKSLAEARGDQQADSLYNIAVCHTRLGHPEAAESALTQALAFDPTTLCACGVSRR